MFDRKDSKDVRECRDAFFGAPAPKSSEEFEFNGRRFIVRAPMIGDWQFIMDQSGAKLSDIQSRDMAVMSKMNVFAAFCCTFVPDGHRLFEDADLAAIRELPADSQAAAMLTKFGQSAISMMNAKVGDESKKALPTTTPDTASSASPTTSDAPSQS